MKRLGDVLMAVGGVIGVIVAIAFMMGVRVNGMPYLVAIGLAKLTFITALGFLAAGAVVRRLAIRRLSACPNRRSRHMPDVATRASSPWARFASARVQAPLHATLGVLGLMDAAWMISPKLARLAVADYSVLGRGFVANLALVFGSLMFLRNARFFSRQAAEASRSREAP